MKVNYLPRNNSKGPYLKRILVLVSVFVFGAVFFSIFDQAIIALAVPVWRADNILARSLRSGVDLFQTKRTLVAENATLRERLSSLEMELLAISQESVSESTLLALAGRGEKQDNLVVAVLAHPPQTPYDVIIVDAGSNHSVALDWKAYLPEGPALGVVSEVFSNKARVKLFSAVGEETNAVLERSSLPVTLVGRGGGDFKLIIPRDVNVEKGDKIFSPEIDSHLLAIVEEVSLEPTDSFKEVLAKSPTNVFTLRLVLLRP